MIIKLYLFESLINQVFMFFILLSVKKQQTMILYYLYTIIYRFIFIP